MTNKRVPLLEERLDVDKRTVETGVVRTKTSVEECTGTIDLSLRREHVDIVRVPVNRPVDAPVPTRQEGDTTIISLHEEVPVVTTQLVLVEEIHLRLRRSVQAIAQPVTLRRERMDVERETRDSAGNAPE
jgi:uncharacterized protein (TIGR02271 family)